MKKIILLLARLTLFATACSIPSPSGASEEISLRESEVLRESEDFSAPEVSAKENDFVSMQYEIGDIILEDGSVVRAADLTAIDTGNAPVAVIAGFQEDGTAFGVGVHRSDTPLQWAADDTENYPAFHFADTYADIYDLAGDYASGWRMPGIEELCDIYQNREAVNFSLQKIYELNNTAAMDGLGTNWYWSSSQSDSEEDYAWFVHYFNGYAGECPQNFTNVHVLVVRTF